MEDINLDSLTNKELQEHLKQRGMRITGNKAVLIERLRTGNPFIEEEAVEGKDEEEEEEQEEEQELDTTTLPGQGGQDSGTGDESVSTSSTLFTLVKQNKQKK